MSPWSHYYVCACFPPRVPLSCPAAFSSLWGPSAGSRIPSLRPLSSRMPWLPPRWSAGQVSMLCVRGQRSTAAAAAVAAAGTQPPPPAGGSRTAWHQVDSEPPHGSDWKKKKRNMRPPSSPSDFLTLFPTALFPPSASAHHRGALWELGLTSRSKEVKFWNTNSKIDPFTEMKWIWPQLCQ